MIKQNVVNYLKCLKYVFTPLGIIALGFVFGLSIAIPTVLDAISEMCKNISEISSKSVDFKALFDNISAAVSALDWSDPIQAIGTMFTKQWFNDTVINSLNEIISDVENYLAQITEAVNACISVIVVSVVVVAVLVLLAVIGGAFLTKWMIRKDIAKRTFKQFIVGTLIGSALSGAIAGLGVWLGILWNNSVYITVPVAFIGALFYSLFNSYFTYGYKKIRFSQVVNIKNVLKLAASDLIVFAIGVAITVLVSLIANIAIGVFVGLGLFIVTVSVMEMSSDSYIKELAKCAAPPAPSPEASPEVVIQ